MILFFVFLLIENRLFNLFIFSKRESLDSQECTAIAWSPRFTTNSKAFVCVALGTKSGELHFVSLELTKSRNDWQLKPRYLQACPITIASWPSVLAFFQHENNLFLFAGSVEGDCSYLLFDQFDLLFNDDDAVMTIKQQEQFLPTDGHSVESISWLPFHQKMIVFIGKSRGLHVAVLAYECETTTILYPFQSMCMSLSHLSMYELKRTNTESIQVEILVVCMNAVCIALHSNITMMDNNVVKVDIVENDSLCHFFLKILAGTDENANNEKKESEESEEKKDVNLMNSNAYYLNKLASTTIHGLAVSTNRTLIAVLVSDARHMQESFRNTAGEMSLDLHLSELLMNDENDVLKMNSRNGKETICLDLVQETIVQKLLKTRQLSASGIYIIYNI